MVTVTDRFSLKRREETLRKVAFGLGLERKKDFRRGRWGETAERISGNGASAKARPEAWAVIIVAESTEHFNISYVLYTSSSPRLTDAWK